jgi:hypothetical protein
MAQDALNVGLYNMSDSGVYLCFKRQSRTSFS